MGLASHPILDARLGRSQSQPQSQVQSQVPVSANAGGSGWMCCSDARSRVWAAPVPPVIRHPPVPRCNRPSLFITSAWTAMEDNALRFGATFYALRVRVRSGAHARRVLRGIFANIPEKEGSHAHPTFARKCYEPLTQSYRPRCGSGGLFSFYALQCGHPSLRPMHRHCGHRVRRVEHQWIIIGLPQRLRRSRTQGFSVLHYATNRISV